MDRLVMRRRHSSEAFVENPLLPGDFWWEELEQGPDRSSGKLYVLFPPRGPHHGPELHWVYCTTAGHQDREPRWWNGDLDRPTIAGSWGIDHFHCWIQDGVMTLEDPRE